MGLGRKSGQRQRKRPGTPNIPVSSFSDIAFLLIIFFIIATTMDKMTGFLSDIPAGEKSESQVRETPTVQLHDGRVLLNKQNVDIRLLRKELGRLKLSAAETDEGKIVLLEATGSVDYQTYFEAMSAISAAGGLVAIVKESEGKKE